jgi:hypothetical protein
MTIGTTVRRRLEAQGYVGFDDVALGELAPWLRWSPAFCTLFMILGVAMRSPSILWALACIALLGAILPFHPFDLLYNHGMRFVTGTRPLPHHGPQRRFACGLAAAWLVAIGWAFQSGSALVGYALGVPLILVAALVSATHFCIPSFIYNALFSHQSSKGA